jgi:hypothetical protein
MVNYIYINQDILRRQVILFEDSAFSAITTYLRQVA